MGEYSALLKAITSFLQKADDDFLEQLTMDGYLDAELTVASINEVEDKLAVILQEECTFLVDGIETQEAESVLAEVLPALLLADAAAEAIEALFKETFTATISIQANSYVQSIDAELTLGIMTNRTTAWIESWCEELGRLMQLKSHDKMQTIVTSALGKGESIDETVKKLRGAYEFSEARARKTAITEVLTAHRAAAQEGYMQSPAVDRKKWTHSGAHKLKPRENHIKADGQGGINGQIVLKQERYTLKGADGKDYRPMFPGDTVLPAGERVNCRCISQGITSDDVFGLTLEERQNLQLQAIEDDNGEWERELSARNKTKAGIEDA